MPYKIPSNLDALWTPERRAIANRMGADAATIGEIAEAIGLRAHQVTLARKLGLIDRPTGYARNPHRSAPDVQPRALDVPYIRPEYQLENIPPRIGRLERIHNHNHTARNAARWGMPGPVRRMLLETRS